MELKIQKDVLLAPMTTIRLGGKTRFFAVCKNVNELKDVLQWANAKKAKVHILGGGSNTVFADRGFDGLVIRMAIDGIIYEEKGGQVIVSAGAGVAWDTLVQQCTEKGLAGLESLSGIPGSVGATPVQNVGAYGHDVSKMIVNVKAIDRKSLEEKIFSNEECLFSYRQSRFKGEDTDRYVITEVQYGLVKDKVPVITYPDIIEYLGGVSEVVRLKGDRHDLSKVREAVLAVRQRKAMVFDESNINTHSCGSFFVNPVLSRAELERLRQKIGMEVLSFPAGDRYKVPAAWLLEQAGFPKGYRKGNVGISTKHNLALINLGGTSEELLSLASLIRQTIKENYDIELVQEPIVVQ